MNIEETVRKVNEILKNDEEYKDDKAMQVQYILLDKDNQIDDIVCYGWDGILSVDSKTFDIETIAEWSYDYETDLFTACHRVHGIHGNGTDNRSIPQLHPSQRTCRKRGDAR